MNNIDAVLTIEDFEILESLAVAMGAHKASATHEGHDGPSFLFGSAAGCGGAALGLYNYAVDICPAEKTIELQTILNFDHKGLDDADANAVSSGYLKACEIALSAQLAHGYTVEMSEFEAPELDLEALAEAVEAEEAEEPAAPILHIIH